MVHPVALICLSGKDVRELVHEKRHGMLTRTLYLTLNVKKRRKFRLECKTVQW